jgi:hypothetical protein
LSAYGFGGGCGMTHVKKTKLCKKKKKPRISKKKKWVKELAKICGFFFFAYYTPAV